MAETLKTLSQHNNLALAEMEAVAAASRKAGVACNNCGNEMYYELEGGPHQARRPEHVSGKVSCPNCGFSGFKQATKAEADAVKAVLEARQPKAPG